MMAGGWVAVLDPAAVGYVVQSTNLGMAHVARVGLALLGVILLLVGKGALAAKIIAVLAFAGATASFAWSGHGASSEDARWLVHLIADVIHALTAAVWLGALTGFCLILGRSSGVDADIATRSLAQFATVGSLAVAGLAITGLINTAFLVGAAGILSIVSSTWGQLLLGKLALVGVMVGLAAHNRFTLTPALAKAIGPRESTLALRHLRLSIGVEMAAGVAVLGLVAVMGVQMPPASV